MEDRGLSLDLQLTHDGPLHCNNHRKLRKLVSKSRPFDLTRTTTKFGSFFTFIFIFSYYTIHQALVLDRHVDLGS